MPSRIVLVSSIPSLANDGKDGRGREFVKYKVSVTSQSFSLHEVIFLAWHYRTVIFIVHRSWILLRRKVKLWPNGGVISTEAEAH